MGAATDFFTGGRTLSGYSQSLLREKKGSSSYRRKATRTEAIWSLVKCSVMGRDSVQGFLSFTGDVHILRREPRVSRKYRVPVLALPLVLTARHPSLSRACVLSSS